MADALAHRGPDGTGSFADEGVALGFRRLAILDLSHAGDQPFASNDPDSGRVWWQDAGVHQNLTFPVQPDPVSGQHCWHQKVTVSRPDPEDRYGDVVVDSRKSFEVYRQWLALARPAPGPGGLRRPLWLPRAFKPDVSAFRISDM